MCSLVPTVQSGLWEHRAIVISQTTYGLFFFLFFSYLSYLFVKQFCYMQRDREGFLLLLDL